MHLYFNMSGIQAREGYQLHVANAKLRLMKYAEVRCPHWSPAPRAWMDHFGPMPPAANVGNQLTTSMASPDLLNSLATCLIQIFVNMQIREKP